MNAIKEQYKAIATKVHDLSFRERVILTAAGSVIILAIIDGLIMQPLIEERRSFEGQQQRVEDTIGELNEKISILEAEFRNHPSRRTQAIIDDLKQRNQRVDYQIASLTDQLIDPAKMPQVLAELLSESSGLQVESLVTKPVEKLSTTNSDLMKSALYRHDFELKLKGNYLAVLKYLEALEKIKVQLVWDRLDFKVDQHPDGLLTLQVHTLSPGEDLIRVSH